MVLPGWRSTGQPHDCFQGPDGSLDGLEYRPLLDSLRHGVVVGEEGPVHVEEVDDLSNG